MNAFRTLVWSAGAGKVADTIKTIHGVQTGGLQRPRDPADVWTRDGRDDVLAVIAQGETIAEYADDKPYPSRLLLGSVENKPLHVVMASEDAAGLCVVVTVYEPSLEHWSADFRTRKMK